MLVTSVSVLCVVYQKGHYQLQNMPHRQLQWVKNEGFSPSVQHTEIFHMCQCITAMFQTHT